MRNTSQPSHPRITFELERRLTAPIDRVFRAFSDPHEFARWCWGSIGRGVNAQIDFRVGGRLFASTASPDRKTWSFEGEYTVIQPNVRIAHTLKWDAPMGYDDADEIVTVDFSTNEQGRTTIHFSHSGNFSTAARDEHGRGRVDVFNALERHLAGREAGRDNVQ